MKSILFTSLLVMVSFSFAKFPYETPDEKKIINYTLQNRKEQLDLLERLVNINSGTENVYGIKKVGALVKPEFEALGFNVQWYDLPSDMHHAGSLIATLNGNPGPRILLIGHLDTVFSMNSPFQKFTLSPDQKQVTGPGVIDNKGGVVTILYAMKALQHVNALKNANITIVLTGDEELAAKPTSISRSALTDIAKNSAIALGFEFALAPDELVVGRRGLNEWFLTSTGKSQHSSLIFQPNVGFGAIYEISRVLHEIQQELSSTPGLTINPGLILGGQKVDENIEKGIGTASGKKTIVTAIASAHGDMRFLSDQQRKGAEEKMKNIVAHPLTKTESSILFKSIIPLMAATKENDELRVQYSNISKKIGGPALKTVLPDLRGGADISYISSYVKAAIDGLGPWGKGAHTETETLDIDALPIATQRAALFILNYMKDNRQ
ncbi:M20 family peptidase [Chryseobacterium nematophagum]|uniref:M20 family peptidase n=1 Tax=Chryseobacterium nematophagum TaxID=2305228 RepID=A0A3M7TDX9_9FLAO|nr:M20 family metallopeptidase [Chryseobacterium nematophagum]RNA61498.1 M20 family peptidase [Chryseobacterium nematophagum]